jgi:hypothetical protein
MFFFLLTKNTDSLIIKTNTRSIGEESGGIVVNTKKRYRIKSRVRFFAFVLIVMLLSVTAANTMMGLNNAEGQTKDQFTIVEVSYGDTIWDIARDHLSEGMDLRDAVHIIMSVNNISAEELQPGQTLKIPV